MSGARSATPSFAVQTLMFAASAIVMLGNYYGYDSIGPVAEQLSRELHFSDTQIGTLNAIYSLPNIFLVLIGGILVDRLSARRMVVATTAVCLVGAAVTALGTQFPVMAVGRLLFGIGSETLVVAVLVALAQWFDGRYLALLMAMNLSLARLGSYLADRSPSFASDLYARGWQPPLWLAFAFAAVSFAGALVYYWLDRREAQRGTLALPPPPERFDWRHLLLFRGDYWLLVAVCITFYSVIFPFRSTFAIKYLQEAEGMTLAAASTLNSYVFLAAVFATPVFGLLLDRTRRNAPLLAAGAVLLPMSFLVLAVVPGGAGLSTALLGVSFSLLPAVLWPTVVRYVSAEHLGTGYGLMTSLQNAGLFGANVIAGYLNDTSAASAANPAGYAPMLWFFGALSLTAFLATLWLWMRDQSAAPAPGRAAASGSRE
ncbi:MAG TPA: MFS transporter [Steroidobacteraceae bacterium]|jgi:MFS family permease|nr:MFS transporter [Steroidobacteraceae bacterium]